MQPNFNEIDKICAGDHSLKLKLISILKKEFPNEKSSFLEHIENKSFKEAAELVHKIKHKIILLSMESSYKVAVDFENELKNGKTSLFSEFILILDRIDNFIKAI